MPSLEPSDRFNKAVRKIAERDESMFRLVQKTLKIFAADVHHPGLNFEKIKGTSYCSIRVNRGDRIVLKASGPDTYEIVDFGDHDSMYQRYG